MSGPAHLDVAVLLPLKSFDLAKQRLRDSLSDPERRELAERLALGVVKASAPLDVAIVSSDGAVEQFALQHQATFIRDAGTGLNAAVQLGVQTLGAAGYRWVVVVHGDLPFAVSLHHRLPLEQLLANDLVLVPDRHHDGTNVLVVPTQQPFTFRYGTGSFTKHCIEATRHGLRVRVLHDRDLALDIDTPADLEELQRRTMGIER